MGMPSNMGYGRVVGRLIRAVLDGPDVNETPDGVPIPNARVTFTADVTHARNRHAVPPVTVFFDPVVVETDSDGMIATRDGQPGVWLVATDDTDIDPMIGAYVVTVSAPSIPRLSWRIAVPEGETVDLATAIPVPASPAADIAEWVRVRGEVIQARDEAEAARDEAVAAAAGGGGTGAVTSVNGQTGAVALGAADVGADPAGTAQGLVDTIELLPGPEGPQGPVGPQGPAGETGPIGPAGPQGEAGPAGADSTVPGPQGPQGIQGETGPQGVQGETGPQGVQGETGPQGIQGETGPEGQQGPQGIQGETGPEGQQGPQGPAGADGADGTDLTHSTPQPAETITGTTYTVQSDDGGELKVCTAATAITVTVPANTVIVPAGRVVRVDFLAAGGGAITFAAGSGMTLDGTPSLVTRGTPSAASLLLLSATSAVVIGDLATP